MLKEFRPKKQVIEEKIQDKLLFQRELEDRRQQLTKEDSLHGSGEEEESKIQDFQSAMSEYMLSMNNLRDYFIEEENDGNGEYLHKLLFDFYKAQAICENMRDDVQQLELYKKFVKPKFEKKASSNQPLEEAKADNNFGYEFQRRMTMREKLQSGKFCSYNQMAENEIQDYQSVSSQQQILENDQLADFLQKINERRQMKIRKYAQRKHQEKQRRESNKIANMLKNTRYSEDYEDESQEEIDEETLERRRFQMRQRQKIAKKLKEERQQRYKWKNKKLQKKSKEKQDQDSSNSVQYDSQQSDSLQNEDFSDESSEQEESSDEKQYHGKYREHFKHLDMYQQMDDLDDSDLLSSGKEKIIHGKQSYHGLSKDEMKKHFKDFTKDYCTKMRKQMERKKQQKIKARYERPRPRCPPKKFVSFNDLICYKTFNTNAKPQDVVFVDEKQQVVIKAIWQYDDD